MPGTEGEAPVITSLFSFHPLFAFFAFCIIPFLFAVHFLFILSKRVTVGAPCSALGVGVGGGGGGGGEGKKGGAMGGERCVCVSKSNMFQ